MKEQFRIVQPTNVVEHAKSLKQEMGFHIQDAIASHLDVSDATMQRLLYFATIAIPYRDIYFVSRHEASENVTKIQENAHIINALSEELVKTNRAVPLMNRAVRSFLRNQPGLAHADRAIAYSFQPLPDNRIRVRTDDLQNDHEALPVFNLHDFSHVLAARVSGGTFAAQYQDKLTRLPSHYRKLTYSKEEPLSDGILWSYFSPVLFKKYADLGLRGEGLIKAMASDFVDYFKGKPLKHPTKGEMMLEKQPDALELAILAQNKRYEGKGADMEYYLYVRGTPPEGMWYDPSHDPLFNLSYSDRLLAIANSDEPFYFEEREVVRNKAMERAYANFAEYLLSQDQPPPQQALCEDVILFINEDDLNQKNPINLYDKVKELV